MKIVHLNTYDIEGGAARSAYRLHKGLLAIGHESHLLSAFKVSSDENVLPLSPMFKAGESDSSSFSLIQQYYINANRTPLSNTLFSLPYPGLNLTHLSVVLAADIINLHWIAYFQSPVTINKLLNLGKPVVWTLHDMWAFTGGCHYSSGCSQYQQDCSDCPQLRLDPFGITSALLKDKLELLASSNLTIVTPSKWLAESARKSQLFCNSRIEVIPYSLETDVFVPQPKAEAKQYLGIDSNTYTLLVGADNGNETRKGFLELVQALKICSEDVNFQKLVHSDRFRLLCFGVPNTQLQTLNIPLLSLGKITSDEELCLIYSAANIFVLPSLEDNLPNTMLEAMSCGTPVIAFNTGGIPDILEEEITGRIVPKANSQQMAQAILDSINNRDLWERMGEKCRQVIENYHALPVQAQRYLDLYKDLLKAHPLVLTNANAEFVEFLQPLSVPVDVYRGPSFNRIFPQVSLKATQSNLTTLQNQLEQVRADFQQSQAYLQNAHDELDNLRVQREGVQQELNRSQEELKRSQTRIRAMETSKFWQMRVAWIHMKQAFGLAQEE